MNKLMMLCFGLIVAIGCSCDKNLVEFKRGELKISVEKGDAYLHDFPLFLGIRIKNPPQIAIWVESRDGKYLSTVYVTDKIATQSWRSAGGNRRKEALPHWCYARGVKYPDGLMLPTKKDPLTDGISGATPQESFDVKLVPTDGLEQFVVKIEVNHSTDFNESYPESAKEGEANYSGGKMGSGQPALVYAAKIDLTGGETTFPAELVGYSSPDGSNGDVIADVSKLTTALNIVKQITITVEP